MPNFRKFCSIWSIGRKLLTLCIFCWWPIIEWHLGEGDFGNLRTNWKQLKEFRKRVNPTRLAPCGLTGLKCGLSKYNHHQTLKLSNHFNWEWRKPLQWQSFSETEDWGGTIATKKKSNSWNERNLISWSVDRVNSQPVEYGGWKSRHPLHNSAAVIFLWIFGPKDFVHLSTCPYSDRGGLLLCAWEGGRKVFSEFHIFKFLFQLRKSFSFKPPHDSQWNLFTPIGL